MDQAILNKKLKRSKADKVYFAEKLLLNANFEPLKLEYQQKAYLRDKSIFRSLRWGRRSGKSTTMCIDALHESIFNKGQDIHMITADGEKTTELARELDGLIHRSKYVSSSVKVDNTKSKTFFNNSRIKIITGGSKSGSAGTSAVGGSANALYLDEIQDIEEQNVRIIIPVVFGQLTPPKFTIAGTPRARGDFSDKLFMDNHQKITDGRSIKKTDPQGSFSFHEYRTCDVDKDDNIINIRSPRISAESLRLAQRTMTPLFFRREFCLHFVDSLTAVYPEELRNECGILGKPDTFSDDRISVAGLDYGKTRNNSVMGIASYNAQQDRWELYYFKSWPLGLKYQKVNHTINNILPIKFKNLRFMLFDKTGPGNAASESLEKTKRPYKQGFTFTQPSKITLAETAVELLESQRLVYYPHPILNKEMIDYTRDLNDQDKVIYKKGESDDFVDALNLVAVAISMYENGTSKYGPALKKMQINQNGVVSRSLGLRAADTRGRNQGLNGILNGHQAINNYNNNLRQARMSRGRNYV